MLWRDFSLGNAVVGFLVALVACMVFPLPRLGMRLRIRPISLLWLVVRFVADVVVSSVQVSIATLRPTRHLRNAVIEVHMRQPTDFLLTGVAEMHSTGRRR